ncbi:RNA polymerase subunit sigma-24 [Verrucomicrobia bacterium LW23]|nr:RNA polymerase subunit sigma-24 [Verrucomicrobia bacterium LW23]
MSADPGDFQNLVDLHYKDLFRFAYSLCRNADDAADLTQQTFVIYAEKGGDVRDRAKIKSWLFTTLYREFLRLSSSAKRLVSLEESELEAAAPVEAPTAAASDGQRLVEQQELLEVLNSLDESYRSILSLFYLKQHSYKEIAEILRTPIGTVMSRLSRAKQALRSRLEKRSWSE